jgi:ketol-acid reductoisomerase
MAKVYYENDADIGPLRSRTVAILGYGSQGRAHALNLRDSGVRVVVGLKGETSKSWEVAKSDGFSPMTVDDASREGDVIMVLIPDTLHKSVYEYSIARWLTEGKALAFAHGYSIRFGEVKPPQDVDVFMVAPKAPGVKVRETFLEGKGVPSLVAVHQDFTGQAKSVALAYAKALGSTRAGVLETTFAEEAESDLFGEQSVLVGGVMSLIEKGFQVLTEAGYQPELAYFEVCNELKLIVDLIYAGGFGKMLSSVSDTAKYGGLTRGYEIVDDHVKENMKKALDEIRNGKFAHEWTGNLEKSQLRLKQLVEEAKRKKIEEVGSGLRKMAGIEKGSG